MSAGFDDIVGELLVWCQMLIVECWYLNVSIQCRELAAEADDHLRRGRLTTSKGTQNISTAKVSCNLIRFGIRSILPARGVAESRSSRTFQSVDNTQNIAGAFLRLTLSTEEQIQIIGVRRAAAESPFSGCQGITQTPSDDLDALNFSDQSCLDKHPQSCPWCLVIKPAPFPTICHLTSSSPTLQDHQASSR